MNDIDQKSANAIPGLRQWCVSCVELADELMVNTQCMENDHFGFMVLSFLSMQKTHMRSLLLLSETRDSCLIARSMIEGMCQLLWAADDPSERGLRWRAYAWIIDWRTQRKNENAGEKVDPEIRMQIQTALCEYREMFLTRKAIERKRTDGIFPDDPFVKTWSGHSISTIIKFVSEEGLHNHLYSRFSDWLHWSPAGFSQSIERDDGRILYSSATSSETATALAVGFQSLVQILEVYARHFCEAESLRVSKLIADYIKWSQPGAQPKT